MRTLLAILLLCSAVRAADDPFAATADEFQPPAIAAAKAAVPCTDNTCPASARKSILPEIPRAISDPTPVPTTVPADLAAAIAALEKSRVSVANAQGALAAAQAALASAQTTLSAGTAQLATDTAAAKKAWDAYLNPQPAPVPDPNPLPVPVPTTHKLEFIEVAKATGCPACDSLSGTIATLITEGVPISRVNIDVAPDPRFVVKAVPTFIVLVDGKERQRFEGVTTHDALKTWWQNWLAYLKANPTEK